jgi:2,4-dienoyl-CoA reductase-like NADH-dependent reductase (Old Yellow Enzyme family)/thioredoxin reductase
VIRNRILQSGHVTGFGEHGLPTERHLRYYETRAKGGIGLIVMEAVAISPHGHIIPHVVQGWRDEVIPWFRRISDAVHAHGAKIFCQAWHNGNKNSSYYSWTNSESCSDVPCPAIGEVPDILDEEGIRKVIRQYVDFCLRLQAGGYDGVELHFGHGYLPQQFLSPFTNIRKDRYGGSLENRMRFGLEVIDAVRRAVAGDFVVGLRTSADEMVPKGLTLDDMKEIMPIWARTGQIDYLNVTIATYKSLAPVIAPMMVPPRSFVFYASEIKQVVDIPVFAAIRINDPVMANDIIKNNEADMVVMTRATICDPEMPNKAREGRVDDVRMCIACNEGCWERITQRDPITCMQNPETGREGIFKILPAPNPRKILVAGGGVAGMEAAIVARQRGHQVVLCEKTGELGGAVLIWTKAPARQEASQTVRFMKHELERLGVEVRLNTQVTPALVETERPDAIIVATGATTVENPLPDVVGPDAAIEIERGAHVVTAEDVLDGKTQTGQRVVVADFQNYMKGLVTAEVLADQGKEVTVIMPLPFRLLGNNPYDMDGPTHVIQLVNLTAKKVKRVSDFEVKRARPGKVTIRNVFTEQEQDLDADTLVLSYWRKADKKLYNELQGKVKELHKIGDCVASRRLINAIYEGYKVAMEI